ncbi:EamA family transporter [Ihubacter sp. mB4P-1]|uniref:EamA family transporter n=1 Tax=Ihubacter sp. mB4P-1 TaxID=3242370 RepID=UPI001379B297
MGLLLALLASASSGISVIFSKKGLAAVDQYLVNGITDTVITVIFAAAALMSGSLVQLTELAHPGYLAISSVTLAVTWVFYYLGLAEGPAGGVLALQNLSIVFTMVLEHLVLAAPLTVPMLAGAVLIGIASVLMTLPTAGDKGTAQQTKSYRWIVYEILSAAFMSVSFVFTKMDTSPVDSNVASMLRYGVVALVAWICVPVFTKNVREKVTHIDKGAWESVLLGAVFLGAGYICLYRAMTMETATLVTTVFRFNIVITVALSVFFLKEKQEKSSIAGLVAMTAGIVLFAV